MSENTRKIIEFAATVSCFKGHKKTEDCEREITTVIGNLGKRNEKAKKYIESWSGIFDTYPFSGLLPEGSASAFIK